MTLLPLAHGIGSVQDPPIPQWLAYYGGAAVLVLSFAALGALWRTPRLEHERLRPLLRRPRSCAPRPRGRARARSLRRRLRRGALRRALRRHQPRSDLHLGALLGRPRPAHDPVRKRLGLAQPVARRSRLRRVVLAPGGTRVGTAVHLSRAARSLAGCVPPPLLRRDGARVHGPVRPADAGPRRRDLQLGHLGRDGRLRAGRLAPKRRGVHRLLRPDLPAVDLDAARAATRAPRTSAQRRAGPRASRHGRVRRRHARVGRVRRFQPHELTGRTGSSGSTRTSARSASTFWALS